MKRRLSFAFAFAFTGTFTLLLALSYGASASQYPPKAVTCGVAPAAGSAGAEVMVLGVHWMADSSVSVSFVQNGTTAMGTVQATDSGKLRNETLVIPTTATDGKATLSFSGTDFSGRATECTSNFRVVSSHSTNATVPGTPGFTTGMLIALGGIVGAGLVIHRRRNRSLTAANVRRGAR